MLRVPSSRPWSTRSPVTRAVESPRRVKSTAPKKRVAHTRVRAVHPEPYDDLPKDRPPRRIEYTTGIEALPRAYFTYKYRPPMSMGQPRATHSASAKGTTKSKRRASSRAPVGVRADSPTPGSDGRHRAHSERIVPSLALTPQISESDPSSPHGSTHYVIPTAPTPSAHPQLVSSGITREFRLSGSEPLPLCSAINPLGTGVDSSEVTAGLMTPKIVHSSTIFQMNTPVPDPLDGYLSGVTPQETRSRPAKGARPYRRTVQFDVESTASTPCERTRPTIFDPRPAQPSPTSGRRVPDTDMSLADFMFVDL
ncbi:hypothetical protein GMRT_15983 [Giardia muris]|uniref:Uncharacterized protein n=1 Tax=Giardia muris TaxID=5742 RepID=A0A4Z1SU10_GIAMU|nr:hypothetical protein GMRT_15983 [Giardia muris]|eukprot:TNJ29402.1 hypothetical protein GMRT_15983 [Giardia muris]